MRKAAPYLLLAVLFAGAGWYALTKKPDPVHKIAVEQTSPALVSEAVEVDEGTALEPYAIVLDEKAVEPEPEVAVEPLPPLNASDPQLAGSLVAVFGPDVVNKYLVKDQVISRMVSMFDSLTSRQVPPLINPLKPAGGKMIVASDGDQLILSEDNYARYDDYVQELQKTDSADLLNLYQHYQPLFQQAWLDNGGEGSFTQRLTEVIDELLATPDVAQPVYVTKPEAVYVFEDPALEAMQLAEIKAGLAAE